MYDASNPKGRYTFDVIKEQSIDIITPGNHELYQRNTSINEFYKTVPSFKDSYIASNLDIVDPETGKQEALAPRFRKFITKNQGIRVVAFGFLFDFHGNANNTVVQPVEQTVKEPWFLDAIRDRDVDLFVVAGHVPCRDSPEFTAVHKAIRNAQWDTPIQFFGGHTHIRDYIKYDKKAYCLESGRYMETIGFQSIQGLRAGGKAVAEKSPTYERRYIDNNLFSMRHHTGKNKTSFSTPRGKNVSTMITDARKKLNLDKTYGCAPKNYWLNRTPFPSENSLLSWLRNSVLYDVAKSNSSSSKATTVITNTGAMRFDIFKGPFTTDTTFLVSPFTSGFRKLRSIPYASATQVLRLLNNEGQITLHELMEHSKSHSDLSDFHTLGAHMLSQLAPPNPPTTWPQPETASHHVQTPLGSHQDLTPGYTTIDDAGSEGDDTLHAPITFYDVPNCMGVHVGVDEGHPPDTVELVYNEFIESWVLLALRYLGLEYTMEDTESTWGGKTLTDLISGWVAENWKCE